MRSGSSPFREIACLCLFSTYNFSAPYFLLLILDRLRVASHVIVVVVSLFPQIWAPTSASHLSPDRNLNSIVSPECLCLTSFIDSHTHFYRFRFSEFTNYGSSKRSDACLHERLGSEFQSHLCPAWLLVCLNSIFDWSRVSFPDWFGR